MITVLTDNYNVATLLVLAALGLITKYLKGLHELPKESSRERADRCIQIAQVVAAVATSGAWIVAKSNLANEPLAWVAVGWLTVSAAFAIAMIELSLMRRCSATGLWRWR